MEVKPRQQMKIEEIARRISNFERENESIMEALRLFSISNAEYERALRALSPTGTSTSASTEALSQEHPGPNGVVD